MAWRIRFARVAALLVLVGGVGAGGERGHPKLRP